MMPLKIAILASGVGSNAQAIIDKINAGVLDAEISIIVSNKPDAPVLEKARMAGLPHDIVNNRAFPDRSSFDHALVDVVAKAGCDYVVLAGYMLLLTPYFLNSFSGNVINIHPALLPAFPGTAGAKSALEYGVKISGPSVHFVEEQVDSGPLIIQGAVPVIAGEPLANLQKRIHEMEHRIYPQAIQWLAEGRISRQGRTVLLADSPKKKVVPQDNWLVWPPLEEGF